jgi:DNA-binding transcriptional LysR family regulator
MLKRLKFEFLFDDSYVVAAGAQNPWVRRRSIDLTELANESWVLPPPAMETVIGDVATRAFRAIGLDYPRTAVLTISPEARISLLETGRYLTIFPTSIVTFHNRRSEIKILPVGLPRAKALNGIVTLKSRTLSPIARLFIEQAREVAKLFAKRK